MTLTTMPSPCNHRFVLTALLIFLKASLSSATDSDILRDSSPAAIVTSDVIADQSFQYNADRKNCQIIFVIGAEDPSHHKFTPIIEELAKQQVDPTTNTPYQVSRSDGTLRSVLFNQPMLVDMLLMFRGKYDPERLPERAISKVCPDDGAKHVIIEESTFSSDARPSSSLIAHGGLRGSIANDWSESEYLDAYYNFYAPYADIKFVTLHRPLADMVRSHEKWKGDETKQYANELRATFQSLNKFLDSPVKTEHDEEAISAEKTWSLVCLEQLTPNYFPGDLLTLARRNVLSNVATFLKWPSTSCAECFDTWDEDYYNGDSESVGELEELMDLVSIEYYRVEMEGVSWPPVVEHGFPCRL